MKITSAISPGFLFQLLEMFPIGCYVFVLPFTELQVHGYALCVGGIFVMKKTGTSGRERLMIKLNVEVQNKWNVLDPLWSIKIKVKDILASWTSTTQSHFGSFSCIFRKPNKITTQHSCMLRLNFHHNSRHNIIFPQEPAAWNLPSTFNSWPIFTGMKRALHVCHMTVIFKEWHNL